MPTTLTNDQLKGLAERFALVLLTWATTKGYITPAQVTEYAPLLVGLLGVAYAWWVNRPKAIVQSAAALPGTTVVTTTELAHSTPEENIVSNIEKEVVSK